MNYVNEIKIAGKVNEPNFLKGVKNCLKFSVLTKHTVETDNELFEINTWHNVVIFGEDAEKFLHRIEKNTFVEITGRFTKRKHNGKYYDQIEAKEIKVN